MGWLLYHRKKDDKYRIYSTVVDGYVTKWDTKENIKDFWIKSKIESAKEQVEAYMNWIDKEI